MVERDAGVDDADRHPAVPRRMRVHELRRPVSCVGMYGFTRGVVAPGGVCGSTGLIASGRGSGSGITESTSRPGLPAGRTPPGPCRAGPRPDVAELVVLIPDGCAEALEPVGDGLRLARLCGDRHGSPSSCLPRAPWRPQLAPPWTACRRVRRPGLSLQPGRASVRRLPTAGPHGSTFLAFLPL